MLKIDYYKDGDFKGLFELMKSWGDEYSFDEQIIKSSIGNILNNKESKLLLAKNDEKIVGYAQIVKCYYLGFEPFIEIVQLLVSEDQRSKGIGKHLMDKIEADAIKEKIYNIKLHSQVQRSRAHVFYEKLGYCYFKISKFYQKKLK